MQAAKQAAGQGLADVAWKEGFWGQNATEPCRTCHACGPTRLMACTTATSSIKHPTNLHANGSSSDAASWILRHVLCTAENSCFSTC